MDTAMDLLDEGKKLIRKRTKLVPDFGVILGSGLGSFADTVEEAVVVGYSELPGFPLSTAPGHAGRLILGRLGGRKVAIMQGRFHFYEGYSMDRVVLGVRLLGRLGAPMVIVTNAAGGIRSDLAPGDLMLISDHINLMGQNPLVGPNVDVLGPRFPDMSDAYSKSLREQAHSIAQECGIELKEGVFAALSGPSYETPAEINFLRLIGADAVAMSTVPEVIAARHMNMRVLGISCISNLAAGLSKQPLSHAEVTEIANRTQATFNKLLMGLIAHLTGEGHAS
jgi:purine-nucleoside phosphorylase